jgi:pre-rRNA-processing protein TSR1
VPSLTRVFDFSSSSPSSEVSNALRALCESKPADVRWREGRPWILAEEVGFEDGEEGEKGTLKVTGVVRGAPLSADLLVHLTGWGDYRVSRVGPVPFFSQPLSNM